MLRISLVVSLCVACLGACAGPEPEKADAPMREEAAPRMPEAARAVQEGVEAIRAEAEADANPRRDPVMEERCAQVTQAEMDEVEERMTRMASETVMLGPEEMLALSCSRYQKSLSGESY